MATVTEPTRTRDLGAAHQKVRHPLQKLRGYIRWFVIAEALIVLVSCLAAAFWLGVGIDFFFHRVLKFDWVLDAPLAVRAVLLGTALLGVAFFVDLRKALKIQIDPEREKNRGASAFLVWLARNPWCIAVIAIGFVAIYYAAWVVIASLRGDASLNALGVGLVVAGFLGLFTALVVVKRMLYEFRDPALAMVLERRYPQLLGDRLITAVELHDPKEAEQLGYSPIMLENTIQEASERVDQIRLGEVFRWRRLWLHAGLALFLTFGIYLLAWGTAAAVAAIREQPVGARQLHELNNVALTSFERLVLLEDERWPPEMLPPILVEALDDTKEDSELEFRIGKTKIFRVPQYDEEDDRTGKLKLYTLLFEMAIHDSSVKDRWRPMRLNDVRKLDVDDLLRTAPTESDLPKQWRPRVQELGWTIDELRLKVQREEKKRLQLSEEEKGLLTHLSLVIGRLDKLADDPSMNRQIRKLATPEPEIEYQLESTGLSTLPMKKLAGKSEPDNIWTGAFTKLETPGTFVVKAGDYASDPYEIGIIPPPGIARVSVDEQVPAYLHYLDTRRFEPNQWDQALQADDALLRGKKQKLARRVLNTRDVAVPQHNALAGSNVTFLLDANVELSPTKPIVCKVRDLQQNEERQLADVQASFKLVNDNKTIALTIPNARGQLSFTFDFWDARGAKGKQEVQILTTPDSAPIVAKADPEVIRKDETEQYFVRSEAVIPFILSITDDHGVASVEFVYTIEEKLTQAEEAQRSASVAVGLGLSLSGPQAPLTSLFYHRHVSPAFLAERQKHSGRMVVPHLADRVNVRRAQIKELLDNRSLATLLDEPSKLGQKTPMINRYVLPDLKTTKDDPDKGIFSLDKFLTISDFEKTGIETSRPLRGFDIGDIHWTEKDDKGQREVRLKAGDNEFQKQYTMYVTVEVKDTNVERPGRGATPYTRTFTINVVRDDRLGELITKEEKALYDELSKMLDEMKKSREELLRLRFDLPTVPAAGTTDKPIDFLSYSVRTEGVEKVVREAARITAKVQSDYERIVLEYRTNRLEQRAKLTFEQVTTPLDQIRNGTYPMKWLLDGKAVDMKVGLPNVQDALGSLRRTFDRSTTSVGERLNVAKTQITAAELEVDVTIAAYNRILNQMAGLVTWEKLVGDLSKIEQGEQQALERVKQRIKFVEDEIFRSLENPKP